MRFPFIGPEMLACRLKYWFILFMTFAAAAPGGRISGTQVPAPDFIQEADSSAVEVIPTIAEYHPESMLKVARSAVDRSKFPVIDIHGHFGLRLKGDVDGLQRYVEVMDRQNIAISTSLDARLGEEDQHIEFLKPFADRMLVFCHIDFVGTSKVGDPGSFACNQPGFVRTVCQQLEIARRSGVVGLKFFKEFGLGIRNSDGTLIKIDDPRFDPIWQKCGELQMPVLIHTGDPAAFFQPIDKNNERLEELLRHPEWSFHGPEFPSRDDLLAARNRVIRRHPQTQFIGAHVAGNPENLATVAIWLDEFPNLSLDISSRIGELGRQPNTARKFFLDYQDRILFGTDGPWPQERLSYYWRFLETKDEYFPYSEKQPQPQGLWFIYGLELPDSVLRKVYNENALRLLPDAKAKFIARPR